MDPRGASLLVWSLAQCLAFFKMLGAHGGKFDPEIVVATIESMWKGLAPRTARRPKGAAVARRRLAQPVER